MTKRRQAQLGPKGHPYGGSATRLADGGRGGADDKEKTQAGVIVQKLETEDTLTG